MLAGVPLEEIISFIGPQALSREQNDDVCERYGIELSQSGYAAKWMDQYRIGKMAKEHGTLFVSLFDWFDTAFGHCVLIHNGQLYDPTLGMNPQWPWTRVIGYSEIVLKAPCK
jgi:hypothetical protein